MIATAKILRVRGGEPARAGQAVAAVVAYVQGGQPEGGALAGYYGRGQARGRPRGRLAALVGLHGQGISGEALARLLRGQHTITGRPLLSRAEPADRASRAMATGHLAGGKGGGVDEGTEWLTLAQAAVIAGVGASYLRGLVSRAAQARTAADAEVHAVDSAIVDGASVMADVGQRSSEATTSAPSTRPVQAAAAAVPGREPREQLTGERGADGRWRVRRDVFERWNAQRVPPATVLGYDLVCAAPKSVSLLWAFGDDALRADIGAALDAAVDATIGYLELHAAFGLVAGRNQPSLGLAVASYLHDVSRNTEAHLHIHNIIANLVTVPADQNPGDSARDQGWHAVPRWEWRAVDGEVLLAHIRTAGFVGAAVLRHELSRLRGVAWEPARNGVAELASFPPELLAAFSTRHSEVEAEFAQLVAQGLEPSGATKAAAQRGSRKAKKVLADDAVRTAQLDRLTAAGWTVDQVRQLATPTPDRPAPFGEQDIADLFDRLAGAVGLTEKATTFVRRDVVRTVAAWAGDRADAETIERLTDRFLADPRVVLLHGTAPGQRRRHQPELLYTVEDMLRAEDTVSALIRQGQVVAGASPRQLVEPDRIESWLATASTPTGARPDSAGASAVSVVLSVEQMELVRRLLTSGDLVRPAIGPAGTGKTEAMRALTGILHAAGHAVFATAHGGRQAEELADRIGIPARVLASWLTLLDHTDDPATIWPPGSVLIVDEATQLATRDAERLLRYATRTATVLIVLGDPAQLGSVGAGGWFTHLATHTADIPTLTTVHRQAGPELAPVRAALGALRADTAPTVRAALERLAADSRIHLADSADTLLERAVADWYTERQRRARATHGGANGASGASARAPGVEARPQPLKIHLMAERHREVETLNRAARALLTTDGTLTGPALHAADRQFQVGDEVITLTQAGHTLIPAGKPRSAYIRTGTIGVVTAVHLTPDRPTDQALTVYFPSKGTVHIPWEYLTHRFADGRDGGLTHAYAITAAKAQGTTMDTARAIVTDDATRAGLYVMLSRARTDLAAYLVRRDDLNEHDDDETWLPNQPDNDNPLDQLADRLSRSRTERLATDHDSWATDAHCLRRRHTLAELTALRLGRPTSGPRPDTMASDAGAATGAQTAPTMRERAAPTLPGFDAPTAPETAPTRTDRAIAPRQVVLRRAELAAEAALRAAALAAPSAALVARIGPHPAAGPDRAVWEATVGALAVYHARHHPDAPKHEAGPPPGARHDDHRHDPWLRHRDLAHRIVATWAAGLPDIEQTRFASVSQSVPRSRAIAGAHALLDTGHEPGHLAATLAHDTRDDIRTGAAVLEQRVANLCGLADVDLTLYELPDPATAQQEWNDLARLLDQAEITHLTTRPTATLAAERHSLTDTPPGAASTTPVPAPVSDAANGLPSTEKAQTARLLRVEAALDRQTADAVHRAMGEPANYLTALLGPRPTASPQAATWESAVSQIERYRHHHLGLPFGTSAMPGAMEPVRQALGDRPAEPRAAEAYDQACALHATPDAQLSL
ncbi:MobF family relaxase [Pseudofrankia sp. BMG5.36]|uniref:MobF family relaxase n=1 Tax=Pseudofrankia sp. BMG5.36 TaxID=1834512 RepID=UPI0008D99386|nr:MobF family relaxase [Pseudofrankia sp. BMG5.36]OHV58747.1 TrwC relaxase [Pseudofrankia sp. BMG5.36]